MLLPSVITIIVILFNFAKENEEMNISFLKTKDDAPEASPNFPSQANLERTNGNERKHPPRVACREGTSCDLLGTLHLVPKADAPNR